MQWESSFYADWVGNDRGRSHRRSGVEAYDAVVEVEPRPEVVGGGDFVAFVGYHDAAQVVLARDSNGGEDLLAGSSSASFSGA
jgi:hypothetical protein